RPRDHPAGGATEIIIDPLDLAKAPAPRNLDELVLPPLALEVGLHLRLGGLPNIDDRLALQHRSRQEISARHCHAPPPRRLRPPSTGPPAAQVRCAVRTGSPPAGLR